MVSKFTAEEDEHLINLVQFRQLLYKVSDENYKNAKFRKVAWDEIGAKMYKEGRHFF